MSSECVGSEVALGSRGREDLGQYELQPLIAYGHSWVGDDTSATSGTRGFERLASRLRMGSTTARGFSGRASETLAMNALGGPSRWVPRTRAVVFAVDTINDLSLYGGDLTACLTAFEHSWRTFLAVVTADAAVASNTASFSYSAGWSRERISGLSEITATGGERWTTATMGAYFEFTVAGDAADVVLVARTTTGGVVTFTSGAMTMGTLDLSSAVPQQTAAIFRVRGLGTGIHTVRGTLTSGASATVDSIRIPSTTPPPIVVIGEGTVIWSEPGRESYPHQLNSVFKPTLAGIVAEYPSAAYADLNDFGWDTTALSEDGRHPNDKGCAITATAARAALATIDYQRGLNLMTSGAQTAYVVPVGPPSPPDGHSGR